MVPGLVLEPEIPESKEADDDQDDGEGFHGTKMLASLFHISVGMKRGLDATHGFTSL